MQRFTLFCSGGLANRMKALVSGRVLAEEAKAEFASLWPLLETCGCPYERLFLPSPQSGPCRARR